MSGGLAPLPLANTRLAETTGSSLRSLRMHLQPVGQRELLGRRILRRSDRARPWASPSATARRRSRSAAPPAGGVCAAGAASAASFFSPGTAKSTTRARRLKILSRERLDRLDAGGAVALDVLPQVVRRSQVVLVAVQPIGLAAEPAERFEAGDDPCLDGVPGAFELAGVGPGVARSARSSSLMAASSSSAVWPGLAVASIVNFDPRISDSWVAVTVLRDLLVVDERLVQPARLAAAEDRPPPDRRRHLQACRSPA